MRDSICRPNRKSRVQQINEYVTQRVKPVFRLRKIQFRMVDGKPHYAYVISLSKHPSLSLKEQMLAFYCHLKAALAEKEVLSLDSKCFRVAAEDFDLVYCIEAWQKHADKCAYIQDGEAVVELLHRMSCEQAAYRFKKHGIDPIPLINTMDVLQTYDHPAEKYAALAKFRFCVLRTPKA